MYYEYSCEKCGIIEVQQKISDPILTYCPHCKENDIETPVKKLISATTFVLKGGGWGSEGYK